MEAEGLVTDNARIKLEAARLKAIARARVAGVKDRHIVLFGDLVNSAEEREEVLFGIDVLFPMCREEDILSLFKAEASVNVACLNG